MATVPLLRCCLHTDSLHIVTGRKLQPGADAAADALLEGARRGDYPLYVLFPGPGAEDLGSLAEGPEHVARLTVATARRSVAAPAYLLLVIDGTWRQAKEMYRASSPLPAVNSQVGYVTTYEAAARALALLERDPSLAPTLLAPLRLLTRLQVCNSP
ncbi:hypothetical protein GPECTOR_2g1305 [Gonium pectorale]|uniref:tRNA-uridine aminocarboxypropyltransferase n=1 Tax=Gonium pectorale TaxID=33097 RepID=A0A150H109_GONPE|nr:hypothetical protein GPECTOR_2g1305 [Gonium pectorale]|eukprot:KXZ55755.1 hypothetical protein GPECTOR_2g1305 [Gonium pectorale]